jgi:hypothetical protein
MGDGRWEMGGGIQRTEIDEKRRDGVKWMGICLVKYCGGD